MVVHIELMADFKLDNYKTLLLIKDSQVMSLYKWDGASNYFKKITNIWFYWLCLEVSHALGCALIILVVIGILV